MYTLVSARWKNIVVLGTWCVSCSQHPKTSGGSRSTDSVWADTCSVCHLGVGKV